MAEPDDIPSRALVSRSEAKRLQLRFYFTGKPCRSGHIAQRDTAGKKCVMCSFGRQLAKSVREHPHRLALQSEDRLLIIAAAENRRAQDADDLAARRDRLKDSPYPVTAAEARAAGIRHYLSGLPCPLGHNGLRYASGGQCVSCVRKRGAAYRERNKELVNRRLSERWATDPEFRERRAKAMTQWEARNPHVVKAMEHRRRARLRAAGGEFSKEDVADILKMQRNKCAACRKSLRVGFHADHIVPLALGGDNSRKNIQLLCRRCNLQKGCKHPIDFARWRGLLL